MPATSLLMLGTDFPYKQFLPTDAKIAQVDIRPENLGRRVQARARAGRRRRRHARGAAAPAGGRRPTGGISTTASPATRRRGTGSTSWPRARRASKPIHPQYLARLVSEAASDDAIFTFDVGTPTIWAARYLAMNGRRRLVGSLAHGSMANALPQAIGIQAAQPGRQVISLSGDGGFTMLMGDLITLTQQKLPVKVVIFNNGMLGFVALEMKAAGFVGLGTDLENPDFAAMARAMGIHALRVDDPGDLPGAVAEILDHDGPAVLDVVTATQELSMPPTIELEQVKGFSLWLVRAVMSGRGDEVIDLAKTNLFAR